MLPELSLAKFVFAFQMVDSPDFDRAFLFIYDVRFCRGGCW